MSIRSVVKGKYKYRFLDICVFFLDTFELASRLLFFNNLHGVYASTGFASHQYDSGVVADADETEHAEVSEGARFGLFLHCLNKTF